ncbi:2'-5' RNA ligase family protein [Sphingomonas sp.]|uniref:2'-5' RNA ligase family protein n=1 Tax=Sphingomonas sp. TaxID=28214 RepID=UPI003B3A8160
MRDPAPIIVTALFGSADFAWLDGLRRAHFPPERNVVAAHLTLFHHLPPSALEEVKRLLAHVTARPAPKAEATGLFSLGRGTAIAVGAPELSAIRETLADALAGLLVPQDQAGWRLHVTIQNKVDPQAARALQSTLQAEWSRRALHIAGLATWAYRGGPWDPISRHMFR